MKIHAKKKKTGSRLMICGTIRYGDTNPQAEKKEYINHIEEIVHWMGWEPFKVLQLLRL